MYNHAPEGYVCPFCLIAKGIIEENIHGLEESDIVYRDEFITAFIPHGWWDNNKGHVIIIPNPHFENLYELPADYSVKIHALEKEIAIAFKEAYKCDGVSSRQHNEPDGGQGVWHYHLHVFPRYKGDELYLNTYQNRKTTTEERAPYAEKLRIYLSKLK